MRNLDSCRGLSLVEALISVSLLGLLLTGLVRVGGMLSKNSEQSRLNWAIETALTEAAFVLTDQKQCQCNFLSGGSPPTIALASLSSAQLAFPSLKAFELGNCAGPSRTLLSPSPTPEREIALRSLEIKEMGRIDATTLSARLELRLAQANGQTVARQLPIRLGVTEAAGVLTVDSCRIVAPSEGELSCEAEYFFHSGGGGPARELVYCSSPSATMTSAVTLKTPAGSPFCDSPIGQDASGRTFTNNGKHCVYVGVYQTTVTCCDFK